eukprot:52675-Eustigmatos_ZCMA.PRE.1
MGVIVLARGCRYGGSDGCACVGLHPMMACAYVDRSMYVCCARVRIRLCALVLQGPNSTVFSQYSPQPATHEVRVHVCTLLQVR